nr:hypothetical protein [Tanacetum cinerariifolium]
MHIIGKSRSSSTKSVPSALFSEFQDSLSVCSPTAPMTGAVKRLICFSFRLVFVLDYDWVVPPELAHEPLCSRTLLSMNDEERRKYSKLEHEPLFSRKDILSSKREWVPKKGYKVNGFNQEAVKLKKALPTIKRKDVTSDDDDSYCSHIEDRKEAKRKRKEERKLKKEGKHRRQEERRHRKASCQTAKLKLKAGGDVSLYSNLDKSHNIHEEALSDPKKLEIKLREKEFESLRAKKGVGRNVSPSLNLDKSHNIHEEALSDLKKLEIKLREKEFESLRAKKGAGY